MRIKLTKGEIEKLKDIDRDLKRKGASAICPFRHYCAYCKTMFPGLREMLVKLCICPCTAIFYDELSLPYVRRKVREAIKTGYIGKEESKK